jgi:hypothetical protein
MEYSSGRCSAIGRIMVLGEITGNMNHVHDCVPGNAPINDGLIKYLAPTSTELGYRLIENIGRITAQQREIVDCRQRQ